MFIYHGYPKIIGGVKTWEMIGSATGNVGIHFLPVAWGLLAALTETVGGFLLIIGLGFRLACLLLVIDLTIAALFHLHQTGPEGGLMAASHAIEDAVIENGCMWMVPGSHRWATASPFEPFESFDPVGVTIEWRPFLVGGVFNAVNPSVYNSRNAPVPSKTAYSKKDQVDLSEAQRSAIAEVIKELKE